MKTVIHDAKTNLSRLFARVELGDVIVISSRGVPIARLVPFRHLPTGRQVRGWIEDGSSCRKTLMLPSKTLSGGQRKKRGPT